ncbi:hypothetical protein HJC23_004655 [Cyclotella cryptica]|uniref:RING-type E3 ubiquitin transferase n=1 Tax=Cyclotella cryptica TaxID=29204 RepID=A0ABD3PJI2_9STRA|eukprot:CCRYP_013874-RA/>CCRYP_013874-RA protein AED:0.00 eAED:0.00 QI:278/-1/1/1/-1/1/1/491/1301
MADPNVTADLLASTPLLCPFQIVRPYSNSQSALLRIIADEVVAYDAVLLLQAREAKLHSELQKARSNSDNVEEAKSMKSSKKKRPANNLNNDKIKTLERQLASTSNSLLSARKDLAHLSNFARSALQCEYSKLVVTLDAESARYAELERSVDYLFHDEDRFLYFHEMVGVLNKIGTENLMLGCIVDLPLFQKFQCENVNSPIVRGLMEELHQICITEELRVRCKEDKSKFKLLKYAQDSLERISGTVEDLIKRHYRKKSIRLHPDRKGEEFRPAFREFTEAKDVLVQDKLRERYLREMMNVYRYYGRGSVLDQSHRAWMGRHVAKAKEAQAPPHQEVRRLEGGLLHQCLKGPLVEMQYGGRDGDVGVTISVPNPLYEFYSRVRSITVVFSSTHDVSHKLKMGRADIVKTLQMNKQEGCPMELTKQLFIGDKVLGAGVWEVKWWANLDKVVTDPDNPCNATKESIQTNISYSQSIIVDDKIHMKNLEQLECIEWQCKAIKGSLQSALQKFNNQNGANRYGQCHETVVRAAKMHRTLKQAMDRVNKDSSEVYDALGSLLESSRGTLSQLEQAKKRQEKKDDARKFKVFMAGVLESEDPVEWMRRVDGVELEKEGGDVNRLYQLFIEGKGKCVLLVDSETLKQAALRTDLFSSKQCKELERRSKAVAIQEAKEEEDARAANEQRLAEEEARDKVLREAEIRKKWDMVGNTVVIHGLASDAGRDLNNSTAKVLYFVAERDRFEVECIGSGKKALLKRENLSVKFFGLPDDACPRTCATIDSPSSPSRTSVWNCDQCTRENIEESIECTSCSRPRRRKVEPTLSDGNAMSSIAYRQEVPAIPAAATSANPVTPTSVMNNTTTPSTTGTTSVTTVSPKKLISGNGRPKKAADEKNGARLQMPTGQIPGGVVPLCLSRTQEEVSESTLSTRKDAVFENVFETNPTPELVLPKPLVQSETLPQFVPFMSPISPDIKDAPCDSTSKQESHARPTQAPISADIPSILPSEIGIKRNVQREPMTDGSVSSLNDRSQTSTTTALQQHLSLPEQDRLLLFLRSHQSCIKGNVDEFFMWLVKSEDIDSMTALKEAVSDEEYLAETMKTGNGSSGVKGFKRKAFQRAVIDYQAVQEKNVTDVTASTTTVDPSDFDTNSVLRGMESNAFLPSFLYGDFENYGTPSSTNQSRNELTFDDAPSELVCPITHELMTEDPVLASDGITYERSAIENWFHQQVALLKMAQEQLKSNPHLIREREIVKCGIRSPLYGTRMPDLFLTPNTSVRNMARAHEERVTGSLMASSYQTNLSIFPFAAN